MHLAVLYRRSRDLNQEYPLDARGRCSSKHISQIRDILKALGHTAELVDINVDSYEQLKKLKLDLAFNLCDDGFRNDSLLEAHIPAVLDILQIPYTGSNFFTLATCVNKARTKEILSFHHIPTPEFQVFYKSDEELGGNLKFPLIVKPLHEDASIGIRQESVVSNLMQLRKRVEITISNYHQPALVEKFIAGREVYIGILGNKDNQMVLPISELIFDHSAAEFPICSYEAKWVEGSREYKHTPVQCPAKLDKTLERKLLEMAKKAYNIFDCDDYGRVDFRIDKNDQPYVLEVNPNPDISENAGLAKMAKAKGWNYEQFIGKILEFAQARLHPSLMRLR